MFVSLITFIYISLSIALATIFLAAGITKIYWRDGFRQALKGFGISQNYSKPLAFGIPYLEITIAFLLTFQRTAVVGATLSILTIAAFSIFVSIHLWKGISVACNCFGSFSKNPITWRTLIRNVALIGLCTILLWTFHFVSLNIWMQFTIMVSAIAFAEGWLLWMLRKDNKLSKKFENKGTEKVRKKAVEFSLTTENGPVPITTLLSEGKPVLLVFIDPSCGPCEEILPYLAQWQQRFSNSLLIQLISRGSLNENFQKTQQFGLKNIAVQNGIDVAASFGIRGTPSAVLIAPDGTVVSEIIEGPQQLIKFVTGRDLELDDKSIASVNNVSTEQKEVVSIAVGQLIPKIWLSNSKGRLVSVLDSNKDSTLIVFDVPFQDNSAFLKKLAIKSLTAVSLKTILITTNPLGRDNEGFDEIVIDRGSESIKALHINTFPAVVVVDNKGKLKFPIALGEERVMELLKLMQYMKTKSEERILHK